MEVKIKEWTKITLQERNDVLFMTKMKELYMLHKDNYSTDLDYVRVANMVTKLQTAAEKEAQKLEVLQKKMQTQAAQIVWKQDMKSKFTNVINQQQIYFVANASKYYYYDDAQNMWEALQQESVYKMLGLTEKAEKSAFDLELKEQGRIKIRAVNTFGHSSPNELNMLDRSKWLQPVALQDDEQVDIWMELLITSVAGESQAAKDHLEQIIFWKYWYPQDYKIPAQSPYGVGGALKNTLVEQTLATIFGKHQVIVIGTDEAFGGYNGQMIGKTIVFIDEAVSEKTNSEALKRKVMNPTININAKYGMQGTFDNTALFFIAGNKSNGALLLDGSPTDRRFSVYRNHRSSFEIVAEWFGTYWNPLDDKDPRNVETAELYAQNEWRFSDPEIVAKWLYHISVRWVDKVTRAPKALHDVDYKDLLNVQKPTWKAALETVFMPDHPHDEQWITGAALYKIYELIHERDSSRGSRNKGKNTFLEDARLWLKSNNLVDWEWKKVVIYKMQDTKKMRTSTWAFVRCDVICTNCNDDKWLDKDHNGNYILKYWA